MEDEEALFCAANDAWAATFRSFLVVKLVAQGGEGGGGEGGGLVAAARSNWKSMHMARQSRMLTWKGVATQCAAASRRYVCFTHRGALVRP